MIQEWRGNYLSEKIESKVKNSIEKFDEKNVWIKPEKLYEVCKLLKKDPLFEFDLLNSLTSVDYIDHFEVVYHFTSISYRSSCIIKCKVGYSRNDPKIDSVIDIWRGADYQEREIWDLMGIKFVGHPNLKRIMLWDGFPGHPLRKDFVTYDQSIVKSKGDD